MLAQQREYQQQMLEMQRQAAQQAAFQESLTLLVQDLKYESANSTGHTIYESNESEYAFFLSIYWKWLGNWRLDKCL